MVTAGEDEETIIVMLPLSRSSAAAAASTVIEAGCWEDLDLAMVALCWLR